MTAETPINAEENDGAGGKMPLLDHLIELRSRLLKSLIAIGLAFGVCLYFAEPIFSVLVQPLVAAGQGKIIYTQLFEAFFVQIRSEEHTSELQSLMRISYAVFCLKKKNKQ